MAKFEELYGLNVNDKTEKKGNLTYLSWAWAWAEFKKAYPEASYKVNRFDGMYCTGNDKVGWMVSTEVTAGEQTYEMWLPVMDSRNGTILQPKMTEINKTIMRCLTKNLAMFGLGLYIYAGEDLPEGEEQEPQKEQPQQSKAVAKQQTPQTSPKIAQISQDKPRVGEKLTMDELISVWGVTNPQETLAWLERKIGYYLKDWNADQTATARSFLQAEKNKRAATAQRMREELAKADGETPFPEV